MDLTHAEMDFLKQQFLMKGLTDEELLKIGQLLQKQQFPSNEFLLEEEEESTGDLYIIASGEVSVLKWDEEELFQLPIAKLVSGDMFGEISFMDGSPYSATIKTTKKTVLWKLSRDALDLSQPEMQEISNKLIGNITRVVINRLHVSDQVHVQTLRSSLSRLQNRDERVKIPLILILFFGLANYLFSLIRPLTGGLDPDLLVWGYWFLLLCPTFYLLNRLHCYLDEFGITTQGLKRTLLESLGISLIGIGLFFLGTSIFKEINLPPFFSSQSNFNLPFIGGYFLYCCVKEFIARGVFQTSLTKFFSDQKGWKSVLLASAILALIPLANPSYAIFTNFLVNVFLGLVYLRYNNLIGVIIPHFILGLLTR